MPLPPVPPVTPAPTPEPAPAPAPADSNEPSTRVHHHSRRWSLRFLQHITLAVSLLLLLLGTCLWIWGSKIFKLSPGTCCAMLLGVWALAVYNAVVSAWSAETGTEQPGPAGMDDGVGGRSGLDLSTPGGAAAYAALCGCIWGVGVLAWVFACSKPAVHAPRVAAAVWGTLLGSILHTAVFGWTLDVSSPVSLAYSMHIVLLLSILLSCALSLLFVNKYENMGLIVFTAGTGAWALVRASIMLILLIEISSDLAPADGSELNADWKWPNEWSATHASSQVEVFFLFFF